MGYHRLIFALIGFMVLNAVCGEAIWPPKPKIVEGSPCEDDDGVCKPGLTNMRCKDKKCVCLEEQEMNKGNGDFLRTKWFESSGRCYAIEGSYCEIGLTSMDSNWRCTPGLRCIPLPNELDRTGKPGICNGVGHLLYNPIVLAIVSLFSLLKL